MQNNLETFRMRTMKHEIIVAPGKFHEMIAEYCVYFGATLGYVSLSLNDYSSIR